VTVQTSIGFDPCGSNDDTSHANTDKSSVRYQQ
jgi:hypothetical protein